MATTNLAQDSAPVLSGGKPEPKLTIDAPPAMNVIAIQADALKELALISRAADALGARARMIAQRLSSGHRDFRDSIADHNRGKKAVA